MKIAFATRDNYYINDHFGWAKKFAIYSVSTEGYELVDVVSSLEDHEEEDNKIDSKLSAIAGCSILFCEAIGPHAAARVVRARIHPIKVKPTTLIEEELKSLVKVLQGSPPPWIRRLMAQQQQTSE